MLLLFGSPIRDDFGPECDVDVLASFADDAPWSLWDFTKMSDELTSRVGRPVETWSNAKDCKIRFAGIES